MTPANNNPKDNSRQSRDSTDDHNYELSLRSQYTPSLPKAVIPQLETKKTSNFGLVASQGNTAEGHSSLGTDKNKSDVGTQITLENQVVHYESILEVKDPITIERKISMSNNSCHNKALVESVKTLNDTKSGRSS